MTALARAAPARAETPTARVMICDDSLVIRGAIARILESDPATSVVWGMPGAVAQAGLCNAVLPLPGIAPKLLDLLRSKRA